MQYIIILNGLNNMNKFAENVVKFKNADSSAYSGRNEHQFQSKSEQQFR
jgi:hypothetical protein